MDITDAIAFLRDPLPDDLSPELEDELVAVLKTLHRTPTLEAVPLLLNAIRDWDNLLLAESMVSCVLQFPDEQVREYIKRALSHDRREVRMWAADLVRSRPSEVYVSALAVQMDDKDVNARYAAATALERIDHEDARKLAEIYLERELDHDVRTVLKAITGRHE